MTISKIKEKSLQDDAVTSSKIGEDLITGQTELSETAASSDVLLIYDASTGTLKKIQASNVGVQPPTVSSVSPTSVTSGDGTGNYTFTITGTGLTSGSADLINNSGTSIAFDIITLDSDTQITGVIAKSSLPGSGEPYDVRVTSTNGLRATLENQINIDQSPTFVTASGSLGSNRFNMSGISVNATDPESAGNVTFELQSGSLPPGISLTNTGANGGTATFTGTISPLASSNTTYNFTLRAVDAASNTSSRAFSFTATGPITESFTSSGTFSVPSGLTSVDVLVVGGGGSGGHNKAAGGGAGGLIFMPSYPVTPGGTVSVTVGCGGASVSSTSNGNNGQDSVFGTLTAKGGGGGGGDVGNDGEAGLPGGSGGGGSRGQVGGSATQPTQPGNSGSYGFGNAGGAGGGAPNYGAGGGGGAGAAGTSGNNGAAGAPDAPFGGPGGVGKAYTIADGTTPVYYAGGGGASYWTGPTTAGGFGTGGQGGGGNAFNAACEVAAQPGTANRGGGGGGTNNQPAAGNCSGAGGKGVVIVRY